jgi:enamine deaminase RidA (YjgF/YER057c/UK114 family)
MRLAMLSAKVNPAVALTRKTVASGTPWESLAGYSRAVRVGPWIWVSGTTATNANGDVVGLGHPYAQTIQTLQNIDRALREAGAELKHVVRTRIYVTDMAHWERIAKAHAEFFDDIRPACTLVQVSALIRPELLVEIEADAYIG